METEVGGPSGCKALVGELPGRGYPASAEPVAGKEGGCADLSLPPGVRPGGREGMRFLRSFSREAREDWLREAPLGVSDALEAVLRGGGVGVGVSPPLGGSLPLRRPRKLQPLPPKQGPLHS